MTKSSAGVVEKKQANLFRAGSFLENNQSANYSLEYIPKIWTKRKKHTHCTMHYMLKN